MQFPTRNYDAELFAFCARLRERFDGHLLRQSFLAPSYAEAERRRLRELGVEDTATAVGDNSELAAAGEEAVREALEEFLRPAFPYLPEEGVQALVRHLTGVDVIADVSFHIGTKDLIKSEVTGSFPGSFRSLLTQLLFFSFYLQEYPPSKSTHKQTFYALVEALRLTEDSEETSSSTSPQPASRWRRFVVDLVAARLHGQDLSDVWDVSDPMGTLARILAQAGRGEPESRLLWESGVDSILGCTHIGVYSDKELIGQGDKPVSRPSGFRNHPNFFFF